MTELLFTSVRETLHALLGELDGAFAWLDRVDDWPLPSLVGMSNDPDFAALRADPRFRAIRQRLGLSPSGSPAAAPRAQAVSSGDSHRPGRRAP